MSTTAFELHAVLTDLGLIQDIQTALSDMTDSGYTLSTCASAITAATTMAQAGLVLSGVQLEETDGSVEFSAEFDILCQLGEGWGTLNLQFEYSVDSNWRVNIHVLQMRLGEQTWIFNEVHWELIGSTTFLFYHLCDSVIRQGLRVEDGQMFGIMLELMQPPLDHPLTITLANKAYRTLEAGVTTPLIEGTEHVDLLAVLVRLVSFQVPDARNWDIGLDPQTGDVTIEPVA